MKKLQLQNWSKEQLAEEVARLRKCKKYGIVWEDKPEEVAEMCKAKLPVLEEIKNKEIKTDKNKPVNIMIEGDNYHALSVLNYTHKGKVDVIYIDPPYNTGAKNWKYNNNFVDKDDAYRHSKWLSMMNKRLLLAKSLLRKDGALICAIDDNEQAHLSTLLEEIFHAFEQHTITIVHNPKGVQGTNFSYTHEYAIFVIPKYKKIIIDRNLTEAEMYVSNLRNWGNESLRTDAKNCFYPIIVKNNKIIGFGEVPPNNFHPKTSNEIKKDGTLFIWPIDSKGIERKWRYARQSVDEIKDILVLKTINKEIQVLIAKDYGVYKTVWLDKKYDASEYGTKLLRKILPNCDFDFPKSLYTTYDCLYAVVGKRPKAIILDYFAGSGTTGHALMLLNKEDGGNRKFILCTNNENKIAEKVCYPRIKGVMKKNEGCPEITGISINLKYFKTDFVDAGPTDENKEKMVAKSTEMLCLKESCFDEVKRGKDFRIFNNQDKYLGIIYTDDGIGPFQEAIRKLNKKASVYVFSLDESAREDEFKTVADLVELKPIPAVILNVYKRIFI